MVALGAVTQVCGEERPKMDQYRRVYAGDLVSGDVRSGEKIETVGYLGVRRGEVLLKPNLPSAQAPLPIDVSRLSSEAVRQIGVSCTAENEALTIGGCMAHIHGQVTPVNNRPGLIADTIVVIPPP
jgi:hypothetical protein